MKYGLIGAHLPHSFSKLIHESLGYAYELVELTPQALEGFLARREFVGINVTIPYKEAVMPLIDEIDPMAQTIGAVNTIVNRGGRLIGYNTDFGGMKAAILRAGIQMEGKRVLILGTGGTSKTAMAVCRSLKAASVHKVSRSEKPDAVSYEQAYQNHPDTQIILNTTPVGMYPDVLSRPIDLKRFPQLYGVVDVIYNPLRTALLAQLWQKPEIYQGGGLFMLVKQATIASSLFTGQAENPVMADVIYSRLLREKENLVLVGMPGSGKSTVGAFLAKKTGRKLVDLDEEIARRSGMTIPQIFQTRGEAAFRDLETQVIRELAGTTSAILPTGGGAILRDENVTALKQNGRLFFLDRPLEALLPTADRPLGDSREKIAALYAARYDRYLAVSDEHILVHSTPERAAADVLAC